MSQTTILQEWPRLKILNHDGSLKLICSIDYAVEHFGLADSSAEGLRKGDFVGSGLHAKGVWEARIYTEENCVEDAAPDLLEACRLMKEAWNQLLPLLKNGAVKDYELVLTKAPVACERAIAKAEGR